MRRHFLRSDLICTKATHPGTVSEFDWTSGFFSLVKVREISIVWANTLPKLRAISYKRSMRNVTLSPGKISSDTKDAFAVKRLERTSIVATVDVWCRECDHELQRDVEQMTFCANVSVYHSMRICVFLHRQLLFLHLLHKTSSGQWSALTSCQVPCALDAWQPDVLLLRPVGCTQAISFQVSMHSVFARNTDQHTVGQRLVTERKVAQNASK